MRLARSLKIALAVMVILGTLFMAAPSDARRGHHGRWGGHYWGDIITAITGITTLTTPIIGLTHTTTPIMVTLTGSRPGCASISGAAAQQRGVDIQK